MSVNACAQIVQKGDPDRFLAIMAARPEQRAVLFPIFAFNVEVSRAPWVTNEPLIAEMRLQWWRDALTEIAEDKPVRKHDVVEALAQAISPDLAACLQDIIEARAWDVYREPFADAPALQDHIQRGTGTLIWVASRALGAVSNETAIRDFAYGAGLAAWFRAVPQLTAAGRRPLPDQEPDSIRTLAQDALAKMKKAGGQVPIPARPATRCGWLAHRVLKSVAADPITVPNGSLHIPEFVRRGTLLWRVVTGAP